MSFAQVLQSVVSQVEGAVACSVMGFDGIAVETKNVESKALVASELELSNVWVEYANVLAQLKSIAGTLKTGSIVELSVNSERIVTLIRLVNKDYFVVLALLPTGNYGKARYVLRVSAPLLAALL
jgi:predicted regulator of Ras-like GTPase activity (Roadblock/LC7/MglB family)